MGSSFSEFLTVGNNVFKFVMKNGICTNVQESKVKSEGSGRRGNKGDSPLLARSDQVRVGRGSFRGGGGGSPAHAASANAMMGGAVSTGKSHTLGSSPKAFPSSQSPPAGKRSPVMPRALHGHAPLSPSPGRASNAFSTSPQQQQHYLNTLSGSPSTTSAPHHQNFTSHYTQYAQQQKQQQQQVMPYQTSPRQGHFRLGNSGGPPLPFPPTTHMPSPPSLSLVSSPSSSVPHQDYPYQYHLQSPQQTYRSGGIGAYDTTATYQTMPSSPSATSVRGAYAGTGLVAGAVPPFPPSSSAMPSALGGSPVWGPLPQTMPSSIDSSFYSQADGYPYAQHQQQFMPSHSSFLQPELSYTTEQGHQSQSTPQQQSQY